jgi:hypothetical protein
MNEPLLLDPGTVADDLLSSPTIEPKTETELPKPSVEGAKDPAGRVFDPARYRSRPDGTPFLNKQGYFMPRGGRKPSSSTPQPPPAADPGPVATPAPEPEKSAWDATERASAAGETLPPVATPGDPAQAPGAPPNGPNPSAQTIADTSEDAAELGTRTLYFTVGCVFGSMDEANPEKLEHENLRSALAAYIRTLGWKGTAGTLAFVRVAAYVLKVARKPKGAETVKKWMADFKARRRAAPKPVQPVPSTPGQRAENAPVSIMPRFSERVGS